MTSGETPSPGRALSWAGAVTASALVLTEQYADLPAAAVAFAAAAWVVGQARESSGVARG